MLILKFHNYMTFIKPLLTMVLVCISAQLMALRSDSLAITNTEIHLDIRNFSAKKISGHCIQTLQFKTAMNKVRLDLSKLIVDSVTYNQTKLNFSQTGESLNINLNKTFLANEIAALTIYYQGTPAADPGGWGGFYFTGDYAFNLGVGFTVDPHSYGRAWFPCIDEFTIKSTYEFYIQTDTNYVAACNGILQGVTNNGNSKTWHYRESNIMSAYLAAVSVSQFSILKSEFNGIQNKFPVWLYCAAGDTNKIKSSFENLPFAIHAFEKAFGAQPYDKVGYNLVPFNAGAMEHAGNITYPNVNADGTKNSETLFAHELSHHWWGDAVTCVDASEMWLNEGWASYCEHFFTEQLYGKQAYKQSIAANHLFVTRFAHVRDGAVFSMIDIPTTQTYGSHVYKKGADVIHSLRSVMGDSVFFKACKAYQTAYRYKNASSQNLQAVFEQNGGGNKAVDFFTNWIYEKGAPHVIIREQIHSGNGPFQLKITTEQRPRFTNKLYKNLPIEIFFFKDRNIFEKQTIVINNETDNFNFNLSFKPVFVCLDYDEKLSDAITDKTFLTASNSTFDVPEMIGKLTTKNLKDTALIRLEHHWIGPEKFVTAQPAMSNYRYVTLDGIWNSSDSMDLELSYDGRMPGASASTGYLDHTLIFKTEDSLTVLYRGFPGDYWRPWPDLQFTTGNKNDKAGKVLIRNAQKGDYVFAMYDKSIAINNPDYDPFQHNWDIHPNPASTSVEIGFNYMSCDPDEWIDVYDATGKNIYHQMKQGYEVSIPTAQWPAGIYTITLSWLAASSSKKVVIAH